MTSDLNRLATRFCRELAEDTGRRSMQWRTVVFIGAQCRIRSPAVLLEIIDHATNAGWVARHGNRRVALTQYVLSFLQEMERHKVGTFRSKSRLSS